LTESDKIPAETGVRLLSAAQIADIAHELRSPLGGIEAMADLLDATELDANQNRLVQALRLAAVHLRSVANDLIKSPGDHTPAGDHRGAIGACLDAFVVASEARALVRGARFRLDMPPVCAQALVADVRHLRQILENLVDNALRLSGRGEVLLSVVPAVDGRGEPHARFELRDEGPGLTPAQAERIFGRGVTLDDRAAGAGLGLSIVADLVRLHGGTCGAFGRDDRQGACLWFTFPVFEHGNCAPFGKLPEKETAGPPSHRHVLVIDDHASSLQVLATILDHLGFEVVSTNSPLRGLEMAGAERYGAIFTDMTMPELDGWALVDRLRALPAPFGTCPIFGVSGRVTDDEKARFHAAGGTAFVEKPIGIASLKRALGQNGFLLPVRSARLHAHA